MTMPGYQTYAPPSAPARSGLAKASLVLGVAGLAGLVLCLAGMLPAAAGLVLGLVAIARGPAGRRQALIGVGCSALALLVGSLVLFWLLSKAAECGDQARYPDQDARARCIEREFPFARETSAP
ncbi:DUF4190 domain-containing protein [Actinomadura parmotrematis]|uniref:DUF4190 domain-containing protein n=1 Tax=Actinomadura parmotrematis TaxID=2864039 RepID=A0ABS7FNZ0_9ACTN|nr:DUF4190 domain-containing protein [Actinomadura parmotrematis]MBW8482077.1 DUF4190 domain-containing protein [Actinomadura parmotrematis]